MYSYKLCVCVCVYVRVCDHAQSPSRVPLFVTAWAPLSMGFSWQEYWSGLPFPSPGDLGLIPGQGTRSHMPQLRAYMPQLKPRAANT